MKKFAAIMICLAMLFSTACASVFSADYYDSYPFAEAGEDYESDEQEIRNYAALKSAILELVQNHTEQGFFRFGSYSGSLIDDLAAVCVEIKNDDPLGAYAVESISYDTSRIVSYYTCEISISYKKTAAEIAAVRSVSGLGGFGSHVRSLMESYSASSVVRVYSSVINEDYILKLVEDYYYADPLLSVLQPKARVNAYPASGAERIYEISLDYGPEQAQLAEMDAALTQRVQELTASLEETDELALALLLARQLSDMVHMEQEDCAYPQTAYGALVEGGDDPLGLAMAYKALCAAMGIECYVVQGEYNDEGVGDHAWNIIAIGGEYYHADISRFEHRAFLLSDDDIWGEYYWSKDSYPKCSGSLGPEDAFGPLPEDIPENVPAPEQGAQPTPEPEPEPSPQPGEENVENN